jgi:hypothetical protein
MSLAASPRNRSSITPSELRVRSYNSDHTMATQPARPPHDPAGKPAGQEPNGDNEAPQATLAQLPADHATWAQRDTVLAQLQLAPATSSDS